MRIGAADCAPSVPCSVWCPVPESNEAAATADGWCCTGLDLDDEAVHAKAEFGQLVASSVLFRLSGYQYNGCCDADEYLCMRRLPCGCAGLGCGSDFAALPEIARPFDGADSWVNLRCGCARSCDCAASSRIVLPYGPITAVDTVEIDGVEIDFTIVGDRSLYLDLAGASLAACFDPADPAKGLHVAWTHGEAPPPDGVLAACVLGCEITRACLPGTDCQLPKRVQQVTREGVSWTLLDPMDFLVDGRTGLYEVDLFLSTVDGPSTTVTFPEDVAPIDFASRARARW